MKELLRKWCLHNLLVLLLMWGTPGFSLTAQNLVLNPSFEEYESLFCGIVSSQAMMPEILKHWTLPTFGTSDVFSTQIPTSCANHATSSTFWLSKGSQMPRTGTSMAGYILYAQESSGSHPNAREYLQVPLSEPLVPGQRYFTGMWVSLADSSRVAINNLGMYFSDTFVNEPTSSVLPFVPQVNETRVIKNKEEWVLVQGVFVAQSPARYLIIGNFYDAASTTAEVVREKGNTFFYRAYYFVDDVFVEPLPELVVPNIFTPNGDGLNDSFHIKGLTTDLWKLQVYNRWGKQVYHSDGYSNDWDGWGLVEGVYFYMLEHPFAKDRYRGTVTIVR